MKGEIIRRVMKLLFGVTFLSVVLLQPNLSWGGNESVFLKLRINGVDIEGESTVLSLDRENTIECLSFSYNVSTPREAATGRATGRRQYEPITITKRIDKSTPLLAKALANNEVVSSAEFMFYRPNPADGATQHFYTVLLEISRIAEIKTILPVKTDPTFASYPFLEQVSFTVSKITLTYQAGGVEFTDNIVVE